MSATATSAGAPQAYTIQGREVRLPVEVRDASASVAYYLVKASVAQRLIDHTGLTIAQTLPGRGLCTIGAMVYKDGDLGPYNEVAISFFVQEPGTRSLPVVGPALAMMRGGLAVYIHQLPVNGEFTREAGQRIWGFPKFMSEIEIEDAGDEQRATLAIDGQHVLTQTMRMSGTRSFGPRPQVSFAYRDGVLYRTPSTMSAEGIAPRFRGATIELGGHPLADELRALGVGGRALFSTYIGKMMATFEGAEALR